MIYKSIKYVLSRSFSCDLSDFWLLRLQGGPQGGHILHLPLRCRSFMLHHLREKADLIFDGFLMDF